MMSCKEVSRLYSESLERKLPFRQRLGLWMHLSMCRFCSGFSKQLLLLRDASRKHAEQIENATEPALSGEARQRIRRALENQGSDTQESDTEES